MLFLLGAAAALAQDSGWIQLEAALDEADHYCADIVGTDVEADLDLQAHTCKPGPIEDQVFTIDAPRTGKISLEDYGLCVAADRIAEGASLFVTACARQPQQRWVSTPAGQIHPADDESLCWTVSQGRGEDAGGGFLKRGLTLEACADFGARYNTWILPDAIGR